MSAVVTITITITVDGGAVAVQAPTMPAEDQSARRSTRAASGEVLNADAAAELQTDACSTDKEEAEAEVEAEVWAAKCAGYAADDEAEYRASLSAPITACELDGGKPCPTTCGRVGECVWADAIRNAAEPTCAVFAQVPTNAAGRTPGGEGDENGSSRRNVQHGSGGQDQRSGAQASRSGADGALGAVDTRDGAGDGVEDVPAGHGALGGYAAERRGEADGIHAERQDAREGSQGAAEGQDRQGQVDQELGVAGPATPARDRGDECDPGPIPGFLRRNGVAPKTEHRGCSVATEGTQ